MASNVDAEMALLLVLLLRRRRRRMRACNRTIWTKGWGKLKVNPTVLLQSRGIRVSLHTVTIVNIPAVLCGKPRNVHTTTKYAPLCSTCVAMASIACWRKSLFLKSDDCTSYRQGKSGHSWTNLSSVNISFNNWFAISPKTT